VNDAWQSAISLAESVAAGDAEVSELQGAMRRLATDPDLLRGGSVGRDLAYLTHLCGSVGRPDLSGELMQRMAEEVRDPHGEESARAALLALAVHSAPRWPYFLAGLPTALSILAILGLPEGDDEGAARHASSALALPPSAEVPEEDRLDVELSTVSILAEEARRDHRVQEADSLLDELETLARRVVELRGEDHPKSWSALVALASAEFGAAVSAGDRDRMERAIDVLALAAQKTAATLGASHLRALATLRAFAGAEYEAAALLGPERRLADARAMVESVAARSGDRQEGTESADAPAPGGRPLRRYSVLGPVRAWHGEEPLQIGTPQQRALLAILLLHGDHSATADRLIDGIWGQDPPASAQAAVRTYAFRLRKSLGDDTLVHEAGRYTLRIRDNELDLTLAEKLASDAEAAVAEGDAERARDLYAAALQGFVGEPLAGLPGPFAAQHRERLYRWRQTLLERRLELDLATGRLDEAVAELTALTAADPRSDRLRELLLRAQHRSRTER
jgi:DNA-binding SARP family transcriptional activator